MAWFRAGGGGIPSSLKSDMNDVFNKKFGTVLQDYPPEDWPETVNLMGPLPEKTVSGSVVAFSDGADAVKLKSCAVTIAPTLDGVSSVNVVSAGKNILPNKTYQRTTNILRLGTDTLDGRLSLKAGTYTLSITSDVAIGSLTYTIGGTSTTISHTASGTRYYGSFTLSADTDDLFLHVYKPNGITSENVSDIMLEVGNTVSTYEAYEAPTTHTANLGRTIYGGSVDVVNGTGTADAKMRLLSSLTWTVNPNYSHTYNGTGFTDRKTGIAWSDDTCKSDKYIGYSSYTVGGTPKGIALSNSGTNTTIYVSDEDCPTLQDFLDMLQNEDSKVTLPLATPEDFTFTPVPILSRLGDNTLWSDNGDIEVTYRRDIDLALAQ